MKLTRKDLYYVLLIMVFCSIRTNSYSGTYVLATTCAQVKIPQPHQIDFINNCNFQVKFGVSCQLDAGVCFGIGSVILDPNTKATHYYSAPVIVDQPTRTD